MVGERKATCNVLQCQPIFLLGLMNSSVSGISWRCLTYSTNMQSPYEKNLYFSAMA